MSYTHLTFIKGCHICGLMGRRALVKLKSLKKLAYTNQRSAANLNETSFGGIAVSHNINLITHKRMPKGVTNKNLRKLNSMKKSKRLLEKKSLMTGALIKLAYALLLHPRYLHPPFAS